MLLVQCALHNVEANTDARNFIRRVCGVCNSNSGEQRETVGLVLTSS